MNNAEVFARNPLTSSIPNNGVAALAVPVTPAHWEVLRWELESFVCEGKYALGLEGMLSGFLSNLDKGEAEQAAWWVSGFYGSGKSHFVRVLEYLWRDPVFPADSSQPGVSARSLVSVPQAVSDLLRELSTVGRRAGGLWSASGTLGSGAADYVRMAFLSILFQAAGLPAQYGQARFVMWLRDSGALEAVRAQVEGQETWRSALQNMLVSGPLAQAVLDQVPGFDSVGQVRELLRVQFPLQADVSTDELLAVTEDVLRGVSREAGRLPLTLVVLDEIQQYIGDKVERAMQVQELTEAVSKRFGGQLLLVGTGQSAMGATPQLDRIRGRFPRAVELSNTDVENVIRQVVLRKRPDRVAEVEGALEAGNGEINRQLVGSKLAPRPEDRVVMVADYPILPTRRRLWEAFLRAIDPAGTTAQLRGQLTVTHAAARQVAQRPLGQVVGADFIYTVQANPMLNAGTLLQDTYTLIERQALDGGLDGLLRQRLCQAIFIVSKLPADLGVRATAPVLADLLVEDLQGSSAPLRARIPELLTALVESGEVMLVGEEYRLQTREGAAWEGEYRGALKRLSGDEVRLTQERDKLLRDAVGAALKGVLSVTQGASKEPRKASLHFGEQPPTPGDSVPVWVRDEWSASLDAVRTAARVAGTEGMAGATIFVHLPRQQAERLRQALAQRLAAQEVLMAKPDATTAEAREARSGMVSRERGSDDEIKLIIAGVVEAGRVFQGGGSEVAEGGGLRAGVASAFSAALARLYPQFALADNAKWDTVLKQAKAGNGAALEALGFKTEAVSHPVCRAVSDFIGAGQKGREVRKKFTEPPYGWPQDAVDSALVLLTLSGHLRASLNGSPVDAKALDASKVNQVEFRPENVTLNAVQRIELRKLFQEAGLKATANQEAAVAPEYLRGLLELAGRAGGEAPLPLVPDTGAIKEIQARQGNELLLTLYQARDELRAWRERWTHDAERIAKQREPWEKIGRLLRHNSDPNLQSQADAIVSGRQLLAEPNPLEPLARDLMNSLRGQLNAALTTYAERYAALDTQLTALPEWAQLGPEQQASIRKGASFEPAPAPKTGNLNELATALDHTNLDAWASRTDALTTRFEAARQAAVKAAQPQARVYKPKSAKLQTSADVEQYLDALRRDLLEHIEAGHPVVI